MPTTPDVGDLAPVFTLPGTSLEDGDSHYTLSAERGRPVVLAFYPGDETPVCTRQLCSYQTGIEVFAGLDAVLWGISSQDLESHRKFQANRSLTFPLLADTSNDVFRSYGLGSVLNRRAVFVVDAEGRIAWKHVSTTGFTYQKTDQIADVLRGLAGPKATPEPYPGGTSTPRSSRKRRTS